MKRLMLAFLVLCMLISAASAFAADDGGWTIGADFGYGWGNADDGLSTTTAAANATNADFDDEDGWLGSVAIGYDWSDYGADMRTELEYTFYSGIDYSAQNATAAAGEMSADIDVQTLMFNVYYDFQNSSSFTPYLGVGAGMAFVDVDLSFDNGFDGGANAADGDADATNFAWAVMGGCSYAITDSWDLDMQLRYIDFGSSDTYESGTLKFEAEDLSSTDLTLGLRYTF